MTQPTKPRTSRHSPRCAGSDELVAMGKSDIIDCPKCGRPARATRTAIKDDATFRIVPKHGTVRTRNTDAADERLLDRRRYEQRV